MTAVDDWHAELARLQTRPAAQIRLAAWAGWLSRHQRPPQARTGAAAMTRRDMRRLDARARAALYDHDVARRETVVYSVPNRDGTAGGAYVCHAQWQTVEHNGGRYIVARG